ncbi:hypothetical protein U6B65_05710 [Oscillospiraceae bacterium MB08-C2-2]|nr:hypothetical protein U6B65_05710 [Oscillospiraceae bacterium MB08-C2-2]
MMNTQNELTMQFSDFEKRCLEQPETYSCFYLPGKIICYTSLGYHYYEIQEGEQDLFEYGLFEEFEYLKECHGLPELVQIKQLDALSKQLLPFGIAPVSVDVEKDIYTIYVKEQDAYAIVEGQQLAYINENTVPSLTHVSANTFSHAPYIQLAEDGHIII